MDRIALTRCVNFDKNGNNIVLFYPTDDHDKAKTEFRSQTGVHAHCVSTIYTTGLGLYDYVGFLLYGDKYEHHNFDGHRDNLRKSVVAAKTPIDVDDLENQDLNDVHVLKALRYHYDIQLKNTNSIQTTHALAGKIMLLDTLIVQKNG